MKVPVFCYPWEQGGSSEGDTFFTYAQEESRHRLMQNPSPNTVNFIVHLPPEGFPLKQHFQLIVSLYNLNKCDGYGDDVTYSLDRNWCAKSNQGIIDNLSNVERVLVTSNYWKNKLKEITNVDASIFKIGININMWKPFETKHFSPSYYIYYNNTRPNNNIVTFLKIAEKLPDVKFLAFGMGCSPDSIKQRYGIDVPKNVICKGWVGIMRSTIQLFQASKGILSLSENTLPLQTLQAAACEVIPIAYKDSPHSDLIDNETNGFLLEGQSIEEAVELIKKIETLPSKKFFTMRANSRKAVAHKGFVLNSTLEKFDSLIDSVVKQ